MNEKEILELISRNPNFTETAKKLLPNNDFIVEVFDKDDNEMLYVTLNNNSYNILNDKGQRLDNQDYSYYLKQGIDKISKLDKDGVDIFSAQQLVELASKAQVDISDIKTFVQDSSYIEINEETYKVILDKDVNEELVNWFNGIGDFEYFHKTFIHNDGQKRLENMISDMGVDVILDKQKFIKMACNSIEHTKNDLTEEYIKNEGYLTSEGKFDYDVFLKSEYNLTKEDLVSAERLFDEEVLFTGIPQNMDEMLTQIKSLGGINEMAIIDNMLKLKDDNNKLIFSDISILSDYNKKIEIKGEDKNTNINLYKRDY